MRITEYFDVKSGNGGYTEEYIEKNRGEYPLISGQTVENGIIGYISTFDYDYPECLTYTKDGEKSGTLFLRTGKFSLTSHVNALIVKEKYKNKIILEWFIHKYQPTFYKTVIGRFGVPSLPQSILENLEVQIPDIKVQEQELQEYKKLNTVMSSIEEKLKSIENFLHNLAHTVIRIPKNDIIETVKGIDLFDILPKNSGITEKLIYDNHDETKEELPIFNGSESVWGLIPRDTKIDNKSLKICKGTVIIIVRKGVYAGNIFIQDKYPECIVAEDAIAVKVKEKYLNKVDIYWFVREYRLYFLNAPIGKFSSATFSQELLYKMQFQIPSKSFQVDCSDCYSIVDKKISSVKSYIDTLRANLDKVHNMTIT